MEARRFFQKAACWIGINLLAALCYLYGASEYVKRHGFRNGETEANLLVSRDTTHVEYLFLGTSHGRNFSRFGNHAMMERLLQGRVANLCRGGGGGVVPMYIHLKTFYEMGNRADVVLYFIDPWVLFSPVWNEDNNQFYRKEPFSLCFLSQMASERVAAISVLNYVREKFTPEWLALRPDTSAPNYHGVSHRDLALVEKRLKVLYDRGLDDEQFRKYTGKLRELIDLTRQYGSRLVFIVYPTILGEEPGHPRLREWLRYCRDTRDTPYYDFTDAIADTTLFEDHDHLNTPGVELFTRQWLLPALRREGAVADDSLVSRPGLGDGRRR